MRDGGGSGMAFLAAVVAAVVVTLLSVVFRPAIRATAWPGFRGDVASVGP